jgi:hypothetical protein
MAERQAAPAGNVFDQAIAERATAGGGNQFYEDNRPKNMAEIAWSGARNLASGAAKSISNIAAGAGGLVSKGLDRLGITRGLEDAAKTGHERMNQRIDAALGTQNPSEGGALMQTLGEAGAGLAIPIEKAVPAVSGALETAAHLPPYLAQLLGRTAVNTGYGAIQGEGAGGHAEAGALAGAGSSVLAEGARALGGQIIKSYIKGGHKGAAEGLDIPWFLNQEMGSTGPGMAAKVDSRLSDLRDHQSQIVQQKENLPIPVLQALQNVENKINTSQSIAKNIGSLPAARAQLQSYVDDFLPIADQQTGAAPLHLAWEMKKKAGNDAAALYRAANSGADTKGMTKQGVSAMVAKELDNAMSAPGAAPELADLNPEFSKLIPVGKALARRNRIAGQHNPIGLDELAAVDAGVQFMLHGNPAGMALPLIQRASKSPYIGQLMRDAAGKSGRMTALAPALSDLVDLTSSRGRE